MKNSTTRTIIPIMLILVTQKMNIQYIHLVYPFIKILLTIPPKLKINNFGTMDRKIIFNLLWWHGQ